MTPDEYLASVDDKRRADVVALDALIRETAPDLERVIQYGMLGYGPHHYRYASGREGEGVLIALAAQKRHLSLYVSGEKDGAPLAETFADRLPKASIGKSCVRFTALARVDVDVLRELISEAATSGPQAAGNG